MKANTVEPEQQLKEESDQPLYREWSYSEVKSNMVGYIRSHSSTQY